MINEYTNKIICSESLGVMKKLEDKSVDLVLTDPPYGIKESCGKNKSRRQLAAPKDYGNLEWDKNIVTKEYFDEMFRVSKNQVIFGGNYYVEYLKNSPCWIVWDKNNSGDFADCELAWTSFKSAVRKFKYTWNGMLQEDMKNKEKRFHPTQKPLALFEWILDKYAEKGNVILDPFCGSGTTAVARRNLGMKYICIDNVKEYCDIAEKRLSQLTLF